MIPLATSSSSSRKKARRSVEEVDETGRNKNGSYDLRKIINLTPIVIQLLAGIPIEVLVSYKRKDVTIILGCGDGQFCIDHKSRAHVKIYNGVRIKSTANGFHWIGEIMVDHNGKPWFRFTLAIFDDGWTNHPDKSTHGAWKSTPASAYKDAYLKVTMEVAKGSENARLTLGIFYEPMQRIFEAYFSQTAPGVAPIQRTESESDIDPDTTGRNLEGFFANIVPTHAELGLVHQNLLHEEYPEEIQSTESKSAMKPVTELVDIEPTEIEIEDWNTIQRLISNFFTRGQSGHQNHSDDDGLL